MKCRKPRYTDEQLFIVKRLFNQNKTDAEIAEALCRRFGRQCASEAIRKVRRKLGLRKLPTFNRWEWKPPLFDGAEVAY